MKKLYGGIIVGIFILSTFLAINLYNSTSEPGFGQNEACNNCHNQPAFIKDVSASFAMNNYTQAEQTFMSNGNNILSTDEVPVSQTNNRSDIEFIQMTFIKNASDIMVRAQIPDTTPTTQGQGSATSDKFGIIFNIDVDNFTVGQFLENNNGAYVLGKNLNQTLTGGDMSFPQGHADFWYVDMNNIGPNGTGMAQDEFISTGIASDGNAHQDVHFSVWYGNTGSATRVSMGYRLYFVRALDTGDSNDAQFTADGTGVNYAIAYWNSNSTYYHHSSFDQMVIIGNKVGNIIGSTTIQNNVTYSTTFTEAASISSSVTAFSVVIVLAVVAIAVPIVVYFIRPKTK